MRRECEEVIGRHIPPLEKPQDVVLYGFGRIGRLIARLLVEKTGSGQQLRLRAIVVRKASDDDLQKRASLLRRDSVHGSFQGTLRVDVENSCIIANGNVIRITLGIRELSNHGGAHSNRPRTLSHRRR